MSYRSYQGAGLSPILVIIGVNLLLFVATLASQDLFGYLSLPPNFDRPWAIVTSMFVHSGLFHILANMFTLYFFGNYLYRLLGSGRFLRLYFGGGILGSLFFILLTSPSSPSAVGASGAIFALGGALAALRPNLKVLIFPIPVPLPLWVAVIGGFLVLSMLPFVAWQAHLGGLLFGLGAGYFFKRRGRYYF